MTHPGAIAGGPKSAERVLEAMAEKPVLDAEPESTLPSAPMATERLLLRRVTVDDAPAIHAYMSDPEVTRWLPEGQLDAEQTLAFIAENEARMLAVIRRDTGELAGNVMLHPWFGPQTYEIGWAFAQAHWGRGYATEAARALMVRAFETLDAHRVVATCQPQNPASWRVMEKLGLRREAHFLQCIRRPSGEWWDEYFYALLAQEYFAAR